MADVAVEPIGADAIEALRLAAVRARDRGTGREGARFLARALQERLDRPLRRALLLELGADQLRLGEESTITSLTEAGQISEGDDEIAEAALALATTQAQIGLLEPAITTCERALTAEGADRELRLALEAVSLHTSLVAGTMRAAGRRRLQALQVEVEAAATPGERAVLAVLAIEAGVTAARTANEANELGERALAGGRLLDDVGAEHPIYTAAVAGKTLGYDLEAAIAEWSRGIEHSRRRGSMHGYAGALFSRAYSRHLAGDLQGAEADVEEAFELAPASDLLTSALRLATAANVAAERGGLPSSVERQLDALITGEQASAFATVSYATLAAGRLALSRGDTERALELFLQTGTQTREHGWAGPSSMPWRSEAALALSKLGRHEQARELAEEELALAQSFGAPESLGIALRGKAVAVGEEPGVELLRESVDLLAGSAARLEHAKSLIELGAALRRGDNGGDPQEPLREGMDAAHRCGATACVDRAMAELHAAGARPRRPALRGAQALSPKERQTTQLAAQGLGNREIAEAMFLTRRTVEMHLTSAYRKLAISGRDELPAALAAD